MDFVKSFNNGWQQASVRNFKNFKQKQSLYVSAWGSAWTVVYVTIYYYTGLKTC